MHWIERGQSWDTSWTLVRTGAHRTGEVTSVPRKCACLFHAGICSQDPVSSYRTLTVGNGIRVWT